MEESEKRRERLKAIRMEAATAGVNEESATLGLPSPALSNPLIDGEVSSAIPEQSSASRFDFYTDPLAAFSGNKRRNTFSPRIVQGYHPTPPGPNYHGMVPSPTRPITGFRSPGHSAFYPPRFHYEQSSPHGSSVGYYGPVGRPYDSGSSVRFGGDNSPNIGHGRGDSPYYFHNQVRGTFGNADYGRGRGQVNSRYSSQGSRPSGKRGPGFPENISAEQRPDLYYHKDMIEDPWKLLTPIILKINNSGKSWLPQSIGAKKAKTYGETSITSVSQPSLAAYLAASFSETADNPGS